MTMLSLRVVRNTKRCFETLKNTRFRHTAALHSKSMKVAILGAAGRTGSCLSLLLKQSNLIDELTVYDTVPIYGLALELSHIDSRCKIDPYIAGEQCLEETLQDAKIVMITAGKAPQKNMLQDEILKTNANILSDLVPGIIRYCPRALVAVVTSPINSLVPLVSEMYKKAGIYDYSRLFGVTTLDCVRANTFVAEILGLEPERIMVPVIGGSCPETCVPLFSRAKPSNEFTNEEIGKLTHAVKTSENEVLKEYDGKGSSSLAMAFAAARFCVSLCKGEFPVVALRDQPGIVECAYVRSCVVPELTYFASPLQLGPNGIQKHLGLPSLSDYECKALATAIPALKLAIRKGEVLALGSKAISTELCPPNPGSCPSSPLSSHVHHPDSHAPLPTP